MSGMLVKVSAVLVVMTIQYVPWNSGYMKPPPSVNIVPLATCRKIKRRLKPNFTYAVFVSCRKL